jgi:hypothetical protein
VPKKISEDIHNRGNAPANRMRGHRGFVWIYKPSKRHRILTVVIHRSLTFTTDQASPLQSIKVSRRSRRIVTMVAISYLSLALAAFSGALAAPVEVEAEPPTVVLDERGMPNFIFDENHPLSIARREANLTMMGRSNTNYNQNYKTGGTVNFTPSTNKFTLNYNVQQDFVVGVGWNPGSTA